MARAWATHGPRALVSGVRASALWFSLAAALGGAWLVACTVVPSPPPAPTPRPPSSPAPLRLAAAPGVPGDPNIGRQLFTDATIFPPNGCGTCHTLPGVAAGVFPNAPNLNNVTLRPTIAGDTIPSTPENLRRWIFDPPSVKADAKMPKVNVTEQQAQDLAAFLYAYPYNLARP